MWMTSTLIIVIIWKLFISHVKQLYLFLVCTRDSVQTAVPEKSILSESYELCRYQMITLITDYLVT